MRVTVHRRAGQGEPDDVSLFLLTGAQCTQGRLGHHGKHRLDQRGSASLGRLHTRKGERLALAHKQPHKGRKQRVD